MANIWDQTIDITEELVRQLVQSQTNIQVHEWQLIGNGFDNLAYLVNNEFIFRFPRRELGVTCMEDEIALLPYIAKNVSFPLTAPKFIGEPSAEYPYPFAGYPIIKGRELCDAVTPFIDNKTFARTLGSWLKELHSIKVKPEHATLKNTERHSWRLDIPNRIDRFTKSVNQYEQAYLECGFDKELLLGTINNLSHIHFKPHKRCYLHGDLYPRHIIVDEECLPAGLIDWGDVHVGHPGLDLTIGEIFTNAACDEFINSYGGIDEEEMKVAIVRSLYHSALCLPYACQQQHDGFKAWSVALLAKAIVKFNELI